MTGPLYPNQPLVEVATEVRFRGNLAVEAIRPRYQELVRADYPTLFVPAAHQGVAPSLQPIRLEKEDGACGLQLAINSFSYFSRRYPGHSLFLKEVKKTLSSFFQLLDSVVVTRVGWRYINAIPFARESGCIPLARFFESGCIFSAPIGHNLKDLSSRVVLEREREQLNLKLESAVSKTRPGEEVLLLDIDAFETLDPAQGMGLTPTLSSVKRLHTVAYDAFESLITESYRAFLKGDSDE